MSSKEFALSFLYPHVRAACREAHSKERRSFVILLNNEHTKGG